MVNRDNTTGGATTLTIQGTGTTAAQTALSGSPTLNTGVLKIGSGSSASMTVIVNALTITGGVAHGGAGGTLGGCAGQSGGVSIACGKVIVNKVVIQGLDLDQEGKETEQARSGFPPIADYRELRRSDRYSGLEHQGLAGVRGRGKDHLHIHPNRRPHARCTARDCTRRAGLDLGLSCQTRLRNSGSLMIEIGTPWRINFSAAKSFELL